MANTSAMASTPPTGHLGPGAVRPEYIVGGYEAQRFTHPYMARLYRNNLNGNVGFCGASTISRLWVLTAAHCVLNMQPAALHVGVHRHDVVALHTFEDDCAENIRAVEIVVRPEYEVHTSVSADIALIRLERATTCSFDHLGLDDGTFWPPDAIPPIRTATAAGDR
ncbi:hypothetical protein EMIHUDRAFT_210227 [Emiliania huxleyi CCMP1516]|uniref:Peptidase S1 domain-containing protein n=2 Tax=Emiliania huxleyi TaxID=2903 RepID=A0A0D3J1U6_EMIH1|nr:hypothetical protein EMIHUDRAFT_210227 [Emiliania huxleyi CCMP1516]EOD17481.1 hypothetical protein EMIHUDRAFT_210227 [Emiliania huxleyi CCMP1516]|eukprot:XP_005769910.1 hypothetical protein EMIHUDRAFT_210227 [Emiliania huxleyi CCMP1516]